MSSNISTSFLRRLVRVILCRPLWSELAIVSGDYRELEFDSV